MKVDVQGGGGTAELRVAGSALDGEIGSLRAPEVCGKGVGEGRTPGRDKETKVKNFFLHKQSPKIRKEEGMSETKKLRKKTPESSNSCPIPRRIDPPKVQREKRLTNREHKEPRC